MLLKNMNIRKNYRMLDKVFMLSTTLCSFWENLSGHFARFICNHSYCYAFRLIGQTDSLSDVEKNMAQNSAFL